MRNPNMGEQNAPRFNTIGRKAIGVALALGAFAVPAAAFFEGEEKIRSNDPVRVAEPIVPKVKAPQPPAEQPQSEDAEQEIADYTGKVVEEFGLEKKQEFSVGGVMDFEVFSNDEQAIDETSVNESFESLLEISRKIDSGKLKIPISLKAYGEDMTKFAKSTIGTEESITSEKEPYSVNVLLLPEGHCANFNGDIITTCQDDDIGQVFYPEDMTGNKPPEEFLMVVGQKDSPESSQEAIEDELPNIPLATGETGGQDPAMNDLASQHFNNLANRVR
jgi:hypothetical protein